MMTKQQAIRQKASQNSPGLCTSSRYGKMFSKQTLVLFFILFGFTCAQIEKVFLRDDFKTESIDTADPEDDTEKVDSNNDQLDEDTRVGETSDGAHPFDVPKNDSQDITEDEEEVDPCLVLHDEYQDLGYLTSDLAKSYCIHNCTFVKVVNCDVKLDQPPKVFDNFTKWFKDLHTFVTDEDEQIEDKSGWLRPVIDYDFLWKIFDFFLPYALTLIPCAFIATSGYARESRYTTGVTALFLAITLYFYYSDPFVVAHNTLYALMLTMTKFNLDGMSEVLINYVFLAFLAFAAVYVRDLWVHLFFAVMTAVSLAAVVYRGVMDKRRDSRLYVFIGVVQLAVVCKFMHLLIVEVAMKNFGVAVVYVLVAGAMPFGEMRSVISNGHSAVRLLMITCPFTGDKAIAVMLAGYAGFYGSLILLRGLIGISVLQAINFSMGAEMIPYGLYAYMIDLVQPFRAVFELVFGDRRVRSNRFLYGIMMIGMMVFEFSFGSEILFIRVVLFTYDFITGTGLAGASRHLDNVDLSGMAFPKKGALPFSNLDDLLLMRDHTVNVQARQLDEDNHTIRTVKGCGFLRGDGRMTSLLTAKHVIEDTNEITVHNDKINTQTMKTSNVSRMSRSSDPVVSMTVYKASGADVAFITRNECKQLAYLALVHPEGKVCMVTNFKCFNDGDLEAIVDLKQGDSGAPLFGVLNNGLIRYVGCVSRGTFNRGSGNLISVVDADERAGSPGAENAYFETSISPPNTRALSKLATLMRMNADALNVDELARSDDEREGSDDEGGRKKKPKGRIKSPRKNRAFEKRKTAFKVALECSGLPLDKQEDLLNAFHDGRVIEFNRERKHHGLRGLGYDND